MKSPYESGVTESRDVRTAALEQTDAMNNVGMAYMRGQGVEKDMDAAVNWYSKAAEQGHVLALLTSATRFLTAGLAGLIQGFFGSFTRTLETSSVFSGGSEDTFFGCDSLFPSDS